MQVQPEFFISDIRALWHSGLRASKCQKLKNVGQTWMAQCDLLTPLPFKGLTAAESWVLSTSSGIF